MILTAKQDQQDCQHQSCEQETSSSPCGEPLCQSSFKMWAPLVVSSTASSAVGQVGFSWAPDSNMILPPPELVSNKYKYKLSFEALPILQPEKIWIFDRMPPLPQIWGILIPECFWLYRILQRSLCVNIWSWHLICQQVRRLSKMSFHTHNIPCEWQWTK